jgi:hypothetical protein
MPKRGYSLNWGKQTKNVPIYLPKCNQYGDIMKTARQEEAWSETARRESVDEKHRAVMYQEKGQKIMAKELLWDSSVAADWAKLRNDRANAYYMLAKEVKRRR